MTEFRWTDENTAEAARLYGDGLSASEVAKRIGAKTRNQIIGKMHRMKVYSRREPSAPRNAPVHKEKRIRFDRVSLPAPIIHEPGPVDGITIMEMPRLSACRWPIGGTGVEIKFCGDGCDGPYCVRHARIAYQPLTDAQKRATLRAMTWVAGR